MGRERGEGPGGGPREQRGQHAGSRARMLNGMISGLIVVFFLVHGTLGSISGFTGYTSPFTWLVWVGVALVGAHVVVSIVTSREQLTDPQKPPSARKKRHLALKWATGGLLALAAAVHILVPKDSPVAACVIVVLSIVLAVHLCVGSKSLLKDLNVDRRWKTAFRVVVCVFAAGFALSVIVAAAM